jgi:hypothetical protein
MALIFFGEKLQSEQWRLPNYNIYYTVLGKDNISFREDNLFGLCICIDGILMFNWVKEFDSYKIYKRIKEKAYRFEYYKKDIDKFLKHYEDISEKYRILQ